MCGHPQWASVRPFLFGVEAELEDVVEEGEERRQRERGHEDRDKAILDDCGREVVIKYIQETKRELGRMNMGVYEKSHLG